MATKRGRYLGPPKRGIVRVVRYRSVKDGKYVTAKEAERRIKIGKALSKRKRPKKLFEREAFTYRQTELGKWETGVRVSTARTIIKRVDQFRLDQWDGLIGTALKSTNVTTQFKDARMIDIEIVGFLRGRRYVLKQSLDTRLVKKKASLYKLTIGEIVSMLHGEGFRVDYPLEIVDWTNTISRKSKVKKLSILSNVTITIRLRR